MATQMKLGRYFNIPEQQGPCASATKPARTREMENGGSRESRKSRESRESRGSREAGVCGVEFKAAAAEPLLPTMTFALSLDMQTVLWEEQSEQQPSDDGLVVFGTVKWRGAGSTVHVAAAHRPPTAAAFVLTAEPMYTNVSYLKSHLQKCIRKGRPDLAVPTAKHLIRLDVRQFIRRLFIISIEDVDVFPDVLSVLAWYTAACSCVESLQAVITRESVEYFLGLVHALCTHPTRWPYEALPHSGPRQPWKLRLSQSHEQRRHILSMGLRHSYGGLAGDMRLIEDAIDFRMETPRSLHVRPIVWESVTHLRKEEWDCSAIDFHVAPCVVSHVQQHIDASYNEEELRQMMWRFASRENVRDLPEWYSSSEKEKRMRQHWRTASRSLRSLQQFLVRQNS